MIKIHDSQVKTLLLSDKIDQTVYGIDCFWFDFDSTRRIFTSYF